MKKIILFLILIFSVSFAFSVNASFDNNLYYGMMKNSEVKSLQDFLIGKGFLSGKSTGNYLSLTVQAVKNYQKSLNIKTSGYFGPLTRDAVNKELASKISQNNNVQNTNTVTATNQVTGQPILTIVHPTASEILVKGRPFEVSWTAKNIPQDVKGTLLLCREDVVCDINNAIEIIKKDILISDGKLLYTVSNLDNILVGKYNIGFLYNIDGKYFYKTNSNVFNIRNIDPQIKITAPIINEDIIKGRTYNITWTYQDIDSNETINITADTENQIGQAPIEIAKDVLISAGKFSWTVPDVFITKYKISIVSNSGIKASSSLFNLKPIQPKITITSPVEKALLTAGQSYTITWTSQDIPSKTTVNILLLRDAGTSVPLLNNIVAGVTDTPLASDGKYTWKFPSGSNIFYGQYAIYIVTSDSSASDVSDLFLIKPPGSFY